MGLRSRLRRRSTRSAPLAPSRLSPATRAATLAYPLIGIGALHLATPEPFDALVPSWVPGTARFWTYASGAAELAIGAAVAVPRTRRLGAAAAVGLFVAVYPANVQMAWDWRRRPWGYQVAALARLPLQYPMIVHALRVRDES